MGLCGRGPRQAHLRRDPAKILTLHPARLGPDALCGPVFGELSESGSLDGKRYDAQRFLIVIRPDRTATQTIRWYLGRQRQDEVVTRYEWTVSYEWGVKDLVWRRVCKENPPGYECGSEAYRISIKDSELHYSGLGKGRGSTTMRKVASDYRLP